MKLDEAQDTTPPDIDLALSALRTILLTCAQSLSCYCLYSMLPCLCCTVQGADVSCCTVQHSPGENKSSTADATTQEGTDTVVVFDIDHI